MRVHDKACSAVSRRRVHSNEITVAKANLAGGVAVRERRRDDVRAGPPVQGAVQLAIAWCAPRQPGFLRLLPWKAHAFHTACARIEG